jgi:hypothetical protein
LKIRTNIKLEKADCQMWSFTVGEAGDQRAMILLDGFATAFDLPCVFLAFYSNI